MTDLDTTPAAAPGQGGNDVRAKASDMLSRYTKGQKIAAVAAVAAVVLGVLFMTRVAGSAQYAPLFTDLQTSDAAAITEQLDTEGIAYELADGGTSIMVPADQVYSARLKVAADGIPSDSEVGYGVLDQQGLTTSEFGQRVGFQRAMEGELSTTIESLEVVDTATVHLALPDEDAFAMSDQEASASVLVRTSPGEEMSDEQVQTVVNLVASSVENLSPDDVTVADAEGNVLAAPGQTPGGAGGGSGGSRQKQTAQFEQSVATSIESMLTKVVGPGAATATVTADLDFDETNVSRETFEAPAPGAGGDPLAVQDSTKTETYTGTAGAVSGVLGPDTQAATGGGDTDYSLEEADVQYALNRVVESTNTAPGAIEKLSVAVMVDETKVPAELLGNLDALVAAAAGIDTERGDVLALDRMPFDTSLADQAAEDLEKAEEAEAAAATQDLIQTIALGVFLLIVLAVAFFLYRRAAKQRRKRAELLAELQLGAGPMPALAAASSSGYPAAGIAATVQDYAPATMSIPATMSAQSDPGGLPPSSGGVLAPVRPVLATSSIDPEDQQRMARGNQLAEMVDQQPDEVAHLMRGWLGDGRGGRS
jgi:flagellar M-ring protein FliF